MNQKLFLKIVVLSFLSIFFFGCPRDPDMDGFYDPKSEMTYIASYSTVKMPEDFTQKGRLSQIMVGSDFIYGLFSYSDPDNDYNFSYWRIFKFNKQDKSLVDEVTGPDYSAQPYSVVFTIEKDSAGDELFILFLETNDSTSLESYDILIYDKDWSLVKSSPTFYMELPNFARSNNLNFSMGLISEDYLMFMYYSDNIDYSYSGTSLFDCSIIDISTGFVRGIKNPDGVPLYFRNFACDGGFLYTTSALNFSKYKFIPASHSFEFVSSFYYGAVSLVGKQEESGYNSDCVSIDNGKAFFYKNNFIRTFWSICGAEKYAKTLYVLDLATEKFEISVWDSGSFSFGGCSGYYGISGDWYVGKRFFFNNSEIISSSGEIFIPE
ncbi:MAG: hypothetical protein JXR63_09155 [Spirochaetales bacterium]|nr:hypothetical protein [Spirochaetales bacterium]